MSLNTNKWKFELKSFLASHFLMTTKFLYFKWLKLLVREILFSLKKATRSFKKLYMLGNFIFWINSRSFKKLLSSNFICRIFISGDFSKVFLYGSILYNSLASLIFCSTPLKCLIFRMKISFVWVVVILWQLLWYSEIVSSRLFRTFPG